MSKKLLYKDVKSLFEGENYTLSTNFYNDNKQVMDVICPHGHEWKVSYNGFSRGRRCFSCFGS